MTDSEEQARVTDPVCGMTVDPATSRHRHTYAGALFHFCSSRCREKFAADPTHYLSPPPAAAPAAAYTCPMHPEIRADHPGACPICGMALEPVTPAADAAPNPELADMRRRFVLGLVLTVPVVALDMADRLPWLQGLLATPVVFWAGAPFLARAWVSLRRRSLNMFSLIVLGTGAAWLYSLVAVLAPSLFLPGSAAVYFEPAAVITVLVLLGQILELRARDRTGDALRGLLDLTPRLARRLGDGADEEIPLEQVRRGDRLRLRPGDAVPVDGEVLEGRGSVDESLLTGEALPVPKQPGDRLIGGSINGGGAMVMRADRIGAETVLARIVALVAEAQRSRPPIQRLADRVAAWFVPAVIGVAVLAFLGWLVLGPAPALPHALVAAVSVLIIACPCALGLATPMSVMVGIGRAASAGVLIRSAEALERLEKVDTLVVDKTGTLTEGQPKVTAILPAPGWDEAESLDRAASLEIASEHPLAAAIRAAAHDRGVTLTPPADFTALPGQGVTGRVAGAFVAFGNAGLMQELDVEFGDLAARADALRQDGATALFLAIDGRPAAVIAVADAIKSTTPAALDQLRAEGVRVVMLTGDHPKTARAVAAPLDIIDFQAEMTPEDKHRIVRQLQSDGRIVAMAGDGVNDAPALAAADIGIAMGTGADIAMHSASVTLVKGDLAGIARARALSRATMRNIRQNLALAFVYNLAGIPIAAGVLYPAFGLRLTPVIAGLAMALSSVSVIANALRLRSLRL